MIGILLETARGKLWLLLMREILSTLLNNSAAVEQYRYIHIYVYIECQIDELFFMDNK